MKSIRDSCIELLKSEDTRKNIREIIAIKLRKKLPGQKNCRMHLSASRHV